MPNKPNDIERIRHMIEAINKIFRYTSAMAYTEFSQQEMVQDAVMKNFEVLGEAAHHVSKEMKENYEEVEWRKIEGLRHVLVHDYYKINLKILWNTKETYLADLLIDLEKLFEAEQ